MNIAIFGLGYVGSVSAACLAAAGHDVVGVDVDERKLSLIGQGRSPITEPGLNDLLASGVRDGRLRVTGDAQEAISGAAVSLICVGTPSRRNGSLETLFLERVLEDIGRALASTNAYHVVAIRSTLLPGVLEARLRPLLEAASGKQCDRDFGLCVNPEFLREGSAISDFEHPPFTLVGCTDTRAADLLLEAYAHLQVPVRRVLPDEASMVKYASNMFHAIKVAFANEIGALCEPLRIDGRQVMEVFCEDRQLNISPRYLQPGFAFGGSCLPKDLRAMVHLGKELDLSNPLLGSVLMSNNARIQRVIDLVLEQPQRRAGLVGLSFKAGSDDLRESPFVQLAESLIGKGVPLRIYDPDVAIGDVFGRNRAFIDEHLPHVSRLLGTSLDQTVQESDIVIVGKRVPGIERLGQLCRRDQTIIDLVGIADVPDAVRPWSSAPGPARLPAMRLA